MRLITVSGRNGEQQRASYVGGCYICVVKLSAYSASLVTKEDPIPIHKTAIRNKMITTNTTTVGIWSYFVFCHNRIEILNRNANALGKQRTYSNTHSSSRTLPTCNGLLCGVRNGSCAFLSRENSCAVVSKRMVVSPEYCSISNNSPAKHLTACDKNIAGTGLYFPPS